MRLSDQSQGFLEADFPSDIINGKGRPSVIGCSVEALLSIADAVWESSTIQHQIKFHVAMNKA
ncbi:hypothetical protein OUZ56_028312 [Daphnia magna]|uniref:GMP synthase n=1 Tax=Daphnia magna TaxID=35525 RepID=A0ABR0B3H3_9CRUS|nr:hypothetical protein OUZ56_028312 [Daphnia magna]